jgi:tetratricopeptide (TPR) repeat protein
MWTRANDRECLFCFTAKWLSLLVVVCISAFAQDSFAQSRETRLTVVSEPSATVFIDNIRFGRTDSTGKLVVKNLGGLRHIVRVRADGFKETSKSITSAQGDINIPLAKTTDQAELAFQEAERLLSRDRQLAADAYRKAIKLRPNYVAAYIGLARVLSDSGDLDGGLKALRDLKRVAPANAEASAVEGRIYKDSGDEAKAIAAFKRSITQGRGFQPEAYTGLGLLYKEKAEAAGGAGDFDDESANYAESAKDLTTALKQLAGAPDAVILYQLLGLVYEKQKKYDDAIRVYNEFLERFPNSNDAPAVRSFIEQIKKQRP